MKLKLVCRNILYGYVFICPAILWGSMILGPDTCTVNDDCHQAIIVTHVVSDDLTVCFGGCNLYASPDSVNTFCQMDDFPTVWYRITVDDIATVMNIEVYSLDFESPTIAMFRSSSGCDQLEQVLLSEQNLPCVIGSHGVAKAIGTKVHFNVTYYIAISSLNSIGGNFDLCISTISKGFACVVDRSIEVTARSSGGPLEGPFEPNETVSICMNVNAYTAAGNGCQWFQGIVPVFGNGWDPASFDFLGQPLNAIVNDSAMGIAGNGLYGAATWDWFNDVDYHYNHPTFNISDLDGNGRLDMCNSLYEMDCPLTGISGGCCGPCWGAPSGDILPGGWFSYGINGTCPEPGPPIRVDWGDGNSCGGPMGPWKFCFDLMTRDLPDCQGDPSRKDLSVGFYTFADGEVGSWTGSASVCGLDHPLKLSFEAKCGRVTMGGIEYLPPLFSGDIFQLELDDPEVSHWEWNISPFWAVPSFENQGKNGITIEALLVNNTSEPVDITGILIGHVNGSNDIILRKFKFKLHPVEMCPLVSEDSPQGGLGNRVHHIRIYPMPVDESAMLEWSFDLLKDASVDIYTSQGVWMENIFVSAREGHQKHINTSSLLPGVYFISLGNADIRYVTKLIKW